MLEAQIERIRTLPCLKREAADMGCGCAAQLLVCIGSLVAFVIGLPYASKTDYRLGMGAIDIAWWRAMQAAGIIPALLQVLLLPHSCCSDCNCPPPLLLPACAGPLTTVWA